MEQQGRLGHDACCTCIYELPKQSNKQVASGGRFLSLLYWCNLSTASPWMPHFACNSPTKAAIKIISNDNNKGWRMKNEEQEQDKHCSCSVFMMYIAQHCCPLVLIWFLSNVILVQSMPSDRWPIQGLSFKLSISLKPFRHWTLLKW